MKIVKLKYQKNTISPHPFFSFSGISRESGDGALRRVRWSVDMKPRYLTAKPIKFLEIILNIGFNLFLVTRYAEPCSQDNLTVHFSVTTNYPSHWGLIKSCSQSKNQNRDQDLPLVDLLFIFEFLSINIMFIQISLRLNYH